MPIETLVPSLAEEPDPLRRWPERDGQPNRIEPVAKPHFDAPFRLIEGEAIFTIGSCFARHIEQSLSDRGFAIPVLELLKQDSAFFDVDSAFLNNYGTPSIAQELAWALDESRPFDPSTGLAELVPGGFIDMHLFGRIKPVAYDVALKRREAIRTVTRRITECRVVIITLGLAEVWYDRRAGVYLNVTPRQPLQLREPDRYELRVLTFDETLHHLRQALDLIRTHGRPDVQILMTVSPVPMTQTFRPIDVAVANTYSKSVLRAAAEHAVFEYDNVHYFPSFESVTLSDRHLAWREDLIHVTQELVDVNVERMVSAFADEAPLDGLETRDLLAEVNRRAAGDARRKWLLMRDRVHHASDPAFASDYLKLALRHKAYELAQQALDLAPFDDIRRSIEQADLLIRQGDIRQALGLLRKMQLRQEDPKTLGGHARRYWKLSVDCYASLGQLEAAENAARRWAKVPMKEGASYQILLALARAHKRQGNEAAALQYFERTVALHTSDAILLDYAEALLMAGRTADARKVLDGTPCATRGAYMRKEELLLFLSPRESDRKEQAQATPDRCDC
jgi:hypothetical protein